MPSSPLFFATKYRVQKYAIKEYLEHDLQAMVEFYAKENYDLPVPSSYKEGVHISQEMPIFPFTKDIFANPAVTKRFLKYLASNFAENGRDSFSYTCRCASENGIFQYFSTASTKDRIQQNKKLESIFGPLLKQWGKVYADNYVNLFDKIHLDNEAQQTESELATLHQLAKKYGKKLI